MSSSGFESIGKMLMFFGVVLFVVGLVVHFGGKFWSFGRLPGDIKIEREHYVFYFPVVTSLLLSVVLTIILNMFSRK